MANEVVLSVQGLPIVEWNLPSFSSLFMTPHSVLVFSPAHWSRFARGGGGRGAGRRDRKEVPLHKAYSLLEWDDFVGCNPLLQYVTWPR